MYDRSYESEPYRTAVLEIVCLQDEADYRRGKGDEIGALVATMKVAVIRSRLTLGLIAAAPLPS